MLISLTFPSVLGIGIVSIATMVLVIYYLRKYRIEKNKTLEARIHFWKYRTKYCQKSVVQHRMRFLGIGLSCSLAFALIALNWTTYNPLSPYDFVPPEFEDEIIEIAPRTPIPPPPSPPPPPPVELEVVDEEIEEDDSEVFESSIDEEDPIIDAPVYEPDVETAPPPPLPPIPEEDNSDIDEIISFAEHMPMFSDCKDRTCSDQAVMKYIYSNIKYPSIARENGIEGRVTAEFVIEKDGSMSGIKILRGIGAGCDEQVLSVLNKMNKNESWTPGRQGVKKVRVLYRLPVTFALNN